MQTLVYEYMTRCSGAARVALLQLRADSVFRRRCAILGMFMTDLYSRRDMYLYTTYENTTICCDAVADPDRRWPRRCRRWTIIMDICFIWSMRHTPAPVFYPTLLGGLTRSQPRTRRAETGVRTAPEIRSARVATMRRCVHTSCYMLSGTYYFFLGL